MSTIIPSVTTTQNPTEAKIRNNEKPIQHPTSFKGSDEFVSQSGVKKAPKNKFIAGFFGTLLPGVPQLLDGQYGKGAGFLLGAGTISYLLKTTRNRHRVLRIAAAVAGLGTMIASGVDAVKNVKSDVRAVEN